MNKILLAEIITETLDLPSYSKRKFIEDIELNQWLENNCELSTLLHTNLLLSHTPEQLVNNISNIINQLETINNLIAIQYENETTH
jgi:hypothetical protein